MEEMKFFIIVLCRVVILSQSTFFTLFEVAHFRGVQIVHLTLDVTGRNVCCIILVDDEWCLYYVIIYY